jgi:hypothetical protein
MDGSPEVAKVLADAARLIGSGEIIVFGSSALAFWMKDPPRSKDVDVWCVPKARGDALVALMGELSWYHENTGCSWRSGHPEPSQRPSTGGTAASFCC